VEKALKTLIVIRLCANSETLWKVTGINRMGIFEFVSSQQN